MKNTDRRQFLQLMGMSAIASTLNVNIAKALSIPAKFRTGTIKDVEHIVILMQENNSFDKYFGTMRGVRGFADPRAVKIHLPLQSGSGTIPASVFLQPAGAANVAAGYSVPPNSENLGGPANGAEVLPPFRINPAAISNGLNSLGLTYLPGTDHSWQTGHAAWNQGQYDSWPSAKGPVTMAYLTRADIPFHYALADAFTVGDGYHCSIMGPTTPNRCYLWTGCIGNVNYLGSGGTDGHGSGPVTGNGLGIDNAYWVWHTFPEVLQSAGVSWKIYQDLAGSTFAPDLGDGTSNSFAGNFTDNPVLYFNQYATASTGQPVVRKCLHRIADHQGHPRHGFARDRLAVVGRAAVREFPQRCGRRQAAAGLLDRRARRLLRTSGLAIELWRVVHLADLRHLGFQSRGVQQDGFHHQLRRE
jgi:phospholipase C